MNEYSQGVCEDGAAILKNGQMMTIEEILADLRERDQLKDENAILQRVAQIFHDAPEADHMFTDSELAEHDAEVIGQFSTDLSTITNEMKIECIGEFSWEEEADYYDEGGEYVEYVATRAVPWDLCKKIYKQMLSVKLRQKAQEASDANG